jgi:hypothetical protein
MDAPETIYVSRDGLYRNNSGSQARRDDDIPYHRAKTCVWQSGYEGCDEVWDTSCGNCFEFTVDGPHENSFAYCPYCGGRIEIQESE